jgi:hypothetical protein
MLLLFNPLLECSVSAPGLYSIFAFVDIDVLAALPRRRAISAIGGSTPDGSLSGDKV